MKKQRFNTLKVGLPFIALLATAIFVLPGFTFTSLTETVPIIKKIEASINTEETISQQSIEHSINKAINEGSNESSALSTIEKKATTQSTNAISKEQFLQHRQKPLPENLGIEIPFYAQPTATTYTPEYDPHDLVISLKEKLAVTETKSIEVLPVLAKKSIQKKPLVTPTIRIEERFTANKNHPYFELFQKTEQKAAVEADWALDIKAIYYTNLSCAGSTRNNIGGPLVTNKGDKNSLIFTLDYGDRIEYDTLQNCVHPPSDNDGYAYKVKGWLPNFIGKQIYKATTNNIKGSHPAVVKSQWVQQSDNQKQTPMGLELLGKATVKIEIFTTKGKHVTTVADGIFETGKHEFIFPHVNIKKGTYRLVSTVDGKTLSQNIRVKRTRFTTKKEKNSCAALLRAVKGNNVQQVKAFLQTTDPNCEYREEGEPRSPLNAAARKGNIEIGKLLLTANADVEFRARGDEGALMGAARHGHLDFVKLMVENGAKVNKTVSGDGTALINAVRRGHYEIAEYLLKNGADPMLGVRGDENPITHAMNQGDKMLDLLLKYRKQTK